VGPGLEFRVLSRLLKLEYLVELMIGYRKVEKCLYDISIRTLGGPIRGGILVYVADLPSLSIL